ncbi:cupin domain-containing protein [Kribbella sp. NPDC049227]|uniref:cupin domain-containing protein n=1 Tax=Kribbella sp. NPDC049227 TaxID=3364113 RepID=UPI00371BEDE8
MNRKRRTRGWGMVELESGLPTSIRALQVSGDDIRARRLAADGCEILFVTARAGAELPSHDHTTDNATVIIAGGMVLVTDSGERKVGPGQWYQTRAGEQHALRFEADTLQIELRFDVPGTEAPGK